MKPSLYRDYPWRTVTALLAVGLALAGCNSPGRSVVAELPQKPMLIAAPGSGFSAQVLHTTGESVGDYRPPGVLDGMVAFAAKDRDARFVELLVTHELGALSLIHI